MKDHEKNLPSAGHQPPPPPEKHHKREKRRRRGPSFGFILVLLLILAVAAFVILWKNGYIHFGKESGDGAGSGGSSMVSGMDISETSAPESAESAESSVVEIKVDDEKIFLNGEELANAEELKSKITEIGDKKTYNFVHEGAIKGAYDEVKAVLSDLERALSIKVNYNETSE